MSGWQRGKLSRWLWPAIEPRGMSRLTQTYVAYHALAMQLRTVQRERGIESQP